MIDSIYCNNTENIGDKLSAPLLYFNYYLTRNINISDLPNIKTMCNVFILGGGGLLSPFFKDSLNVIYEKIDKFKIKIAWGIGYNTHYGDENCFDYNELLKNFDLVGTRDYKSIYRWVPCASCMHPMFTKASLNITEDIVIYEHGDFPIDINGYNRLSNFEKDFFKVINFLNNSNIVITNTYHGVYWATLLNKKVLVIPFSNRFDNFKHPPVVCNVDNYKSKIEYAKNYPHALYECRIANIKFSEEVFKVLNKSS